MTATAPAPEDAPPVDPVVRAVRPPSASPLMRDALVTIGTRFGLAALIFATDIALARLLGPSAKGRFALVLLYSQLAALIVGWGTDQALAVVSGRNVETARHGFANALDLDRRRRRGGGHRLDLAVRGAHRRARPPGRWRC